MKTVSALAAVMLLGMTLALRHAVPRGTHAAFTESFGAALVYLPGLILAVAVLYMVRGYELRRDRLVVRRLLWNTEVALQGLERIGRDGQAMRRSIRVIGNGGLFSITGRFRSDALGSYRAFVTDPAQAVVMRAKSGVVVLSPADPDAFLAHARALFPTAVQEAGPHPGPPA